MIFQEKCFSCYILLTDVISMSDWLYLSRYWAICVLQLLVNQAVTSKLTFLFNQNVSIHDQRQKLKHLENEKNFWGKIKSILHISKRLSAAKNCLRPESVPLKLHKFCHFLLKNIILHQKLYTDQQKNFAFFENVLISQIS